MATAAGANPNGLAEAKVSDIDRWNQAAKDAHPQRTPESAAVRVEVYQAAANTATNKQPVHWLSPDQQDPNGLAFETNVNYELELRLTNQTQRPLAVMVQIDGLSQIGSKVSLPSDSWYWTVAPGATKVIDQWLDDPTGKDGRESFVLQGRKLVVTDPPSSVAGQVNYWDRVGEIRVLVYELDAKPSRRTANAAKPSIGIGAGTEVSKLYVRNDGPRIDLQKNVATYVIRYRKAATP